MVEPDGVGAAIAGAAWPRAKKTAAASRVVRRRVCRKALLSLGPCLATANHACRLMLPPCSMPIPGHDAKIGRLQQVADFLGTAMGTGVSREWSGKDLR
jgi:hypothetical protein